MDKSRVPLFYGPPCIYISFIFRTVGSVLPCGFENWSIFSIIS